MHFQVQGIRDYEALFDHFTAKIDSLERRIYALEHPADSIVWKPGLWSPVYKMIPTDSRRDTPTLPEHFIMKNADNQQY